MFRIRGSLATQLALVMTIAVLAAAAAQLVVLLVERNRTGMIEVSGPAITRFADLSSDAMNRSVSQLPDRQAREFRRRGARIIISQQNFIESRNLTRQRQLEHRLQRALADLGHPDSIVMAATRVMDASELRPDGLRPFGQRVPQLDRNRKVREIILANQIAPGRWISGTFLTPVPPNDEFGRLFFGALIAIGCVLGAAIWMSARLIRPLTDLSDAAARLGNAAAPQELALRGPAEIRRTLKAFNNMSRRVSHLLREKDVMLGALGHDLRTPLASLRIRVESMEPASERDKAINTIEETTRLLESILDFARTGQIDEKLETVDVAALIKDIAADYQARGSNVTVNLPVAPFHCSTNPDMMRRLLRNLIDNACRHAETVEIQARKSPECTTITVSDDGPGIPDELLSQVKQPFFRGEISRNRQHGGAGLGLALADTLARALNGSLTLENQEPNGLRAVFVFDRTADEAEPG